MFRRREMVYCADMQTLHLTTTEQEWFAKLPESLRDGWSVEAVSSLYEESSEELSFRLRMAKTDRYPLKRIIDSLHGAKNITEAAQQIDLSTLNPEELGELCFLLGVNVLNAMVIRILANATSEEDLEGLAGITHIRNALSDVNAPTF